MLDSAQNSSEAIAEEINKLRIELKTADANSFGARRVVKKIQEDIKKLRSCDTANSFNLEGMLNACLLKEKESRHAHKNAIKHCPNDDDYVRSYATSLINLNCWKDGIDTINSIKNKIDMDLVALARYSLLIGRANDSLEFFSTLYSRYNKNGGNMGRMINVGGYFSQQVVSFIEREGIPKEDIEISCGEVEKVIKKYKKKLISEEPLIDFDDFYGEEVVYFMYGLLGAPEEICEMNSELSRAISALGVVKNWHKIMPRFYSNYAL